MVISVLFVSAIQTLISSDLARKNVQLQNELQACRVKVIRDGVKIEIKSSECVVGDILFLKAGMEIPVDGYVLESSNLVCDESSFTNEVELAEKAPVEFCIKVRHKIKQEGRMNSASVKEIPSPVVLSGSTITEGEGMMVVACVGKHTAKNRIFDYSMKGDMEETLLHRKSMNIAEYIGRFGLVFILLALIASIINSVLLARGNSWQPMHTRLITQAFLTAAAQVLAVIPENLIYTLQASDLYCCKQLIQKGVLARSFQACEILGYLDAICIIEDSVFTDDNFSINWLWNEQAFEIQGEVDHANTLINTRSKKLFISVIKSTIDLTSKSGTDQALERLFDKFKFTWDDLYRNTSFKVKFRNQEQPNNKVTALALSDDFNLLVVRCDIEGLLSRCTTLFQLQSSTKTYINQDLRREIEAELRALERRGGKIFGFAFKEIDLHEIRLIGDSADDVDLQEMTLLCIVGMEKPVRKNVSLTNEKLQKAGIPVILSSSGTINEAKSIARQTSILPPEDSSEVLGAIFSGDYFLEKVTDPIEFSNNRNNTQIVIKKEEMDQIYKHLAVLYQSTPESINALVLGLKQKGHTIALVGGGVANIQAIKNSDLCVSLPNQGLNIINDTARIKLLNNEFSAMIDGILFSRQVKEGVRRGLQFQMVVINVICLVLFISSATIAEAILSPIQIIWIYVAVDILNTVAAYKEAIIKKELTEVTSNKNDFLVDRKMAKHIVAQTLFITGMMMIFIFAGHKFLPDEISTDAALVNVDNDRYLVKAGIINASHDAWPYSNEQKPSRHYTYCFNVLFMMFMGHFIGCRGVNDEWNTFALLFKTPALAIAFITCFLLHVIIVTFGSRSFRLANWVGFFNEGIRHQRLADMYELWIDDLAIRIHY